MTKIALVDDEKVIRTLTQRVLEGEGFEVFAYESPETFEAGIAANPTDIYIIDGRIPKHHDGVNLIDKLRQAGNYTPCVYLSATLGDEGDLPRLLTFDKVSILEKPVSPSDLVKTINEALAGNYNAKNYARLM